MNEDLHKRLGGSRRGKQPVRGQAEVLFLPPKLNVKIRDYYDAPKATGGDWLLRSEVPGAAEIMDREGASNHSSDIVELLANKPLGSFGSKEEYLQTHYELLREDSLRPLREAVTTIRESPTTHEDDHNGKIGIYEKVHICGITMANRGIASRITFSLRRTGKQIAWEQSKRLIAGSLVVLSPENDMFQQKAIVAVVAARPIAGLELNPPEIDITFLSEELEVDPSIEYVMIEDRGGLYEANRHTLLSLQHMMSEPFPLSEHLNGVQREISSPKDVLKSPKTDLTSVIVNTKHDTYENFNILKQPWPQQMQSSLDESQLDALCQILTKRLAIVQGPPGTGKTHVSVEAIKVMLINRIDGDPPIVIACQTNHAVDQMLRHVLKFEEDVVRLGGQSKDPAIRQRTLYEVRRETSEAPPAGCLFGGAKKKMENMTRELALLLAPLQPGKKPLDHRILADLKLISHAQADSLESGALSWVQEKLSNPNDARSPFIVWLSDKLIPVPVRQSPEDFGFEMEETDLELEQLQEAEAENVVKDDDDLENLRGFHIPLADNFTCRKGVGEDAKAKEALKKQDMWKIPGASRAAVYRHLQRQLKNKITLAVRIKAKEFNNEAKKRQIGGWERDEPILKRQKIIGMTTTGFSKYRGLISALRVKTILIEEAAETLEAPVAVACIPTIQRLILVGDHLQLRPHCHVRSHEDEPWYLNISLFERLVKNDLEYKTLTRQRRMIPEIRRLLYPIYKNVIQDHPSVTQKDERPDVPGMGGVNTFFFTHLWGEQHDDLMSTVNPLEADMIVGFVEYLVYNGMATEDITILTFYNGQRKRILSNLRRSVMMSGCRFTVVTVDSYQGEENKVVILSLARSNEHLKMGFLDVENRICVALSRAQCGFYIFGNGMLLFDVEARYENTRLNGIKHKAKKQMWTQVLKIMSAQKGKKNEVPLVQANRLGTNLPLRCENHKNITPVSEPGHFNELFGGCKTLCGGTLPCGHPCSRLCHPMPHYLVKCSVCPKQASSSKTVLENDPLQVQDGRSAHYSHDTSPSRSSGSNVGSWNKFSAQGSTRVANQKRDGQASYVPLSQRSSEENLFSNSGTDGNRLANGMANLSMGLDGTTSELSMNNIAVQHATFANMPATEHYAPARPIETAAVQQSETVKEEPMDALLINFDD